DLARDDPQLGGAGLAVQVESCKPAAQLGDVLVVQLIGDDARCQLLGEAQEQPVVIRARAPCGAAGAGDRAAWARSEPPEIPGHVSCRRSGARSAAGPVNGWSTLVACGVVADQLDRVATLEESHSHTST